MEYTVVVRMNGKLFLRDPESSELGRRIVRQGIQLMAEIGFEEMTFRKLAERINTKEASIYRYFENKHRLLVYLVAWYWQWLEYQVLFQTNNLTDSREKLERILKLLLLKDLSALNVSTEADDMDIPALHSIVIQEASKAYLTHHVTEDNREQLFKPYKDLCSRIAGIILEYRPGYPYARSRASSLIETAHYQAFFMQHLPSLTDFDPESQNPVGDKDPLLTFLRHLLFSSLDTARF
ncbi:TetR/AcrR family transcriptional regulator [Larkinella humicola]|uniref:TetR/AcrR family transcriptional regulator n=1 Tax=Larkinella humicola TaxID=2607654 RepID=A0A5N1J758_9BACT|nr:TetR/AcrR family transcriptional regulator [Larkinella humicola]KAA9347015.1 TetR/AcrR family transcriptional regulator [Larkinella humicola]